MNSRIKKKLRKQREIKIYNESLKSNFDPNGSYTGVCLNKDEKPVQDADDL